MIRRYLVNIPWPQPWLVEALLYLILYVRPGPFLRMGTDPGRAHIALAREREGEP